MSDIAWGTRIEWPAVSIDDGSKGYARLFSSCSIGNNKLAIAYGFQATGKSDTFQGRVLIVTVEGTVPTIGDYAIHVAAGSLEYSHSTNICKLDIDKFVVTYAKYVDAARENIYARVGTVSGTTITLGAEVDVSGQLAYTAFHHAIALSSTKFAVSYCEDISATYRGMVAICTVSGTTITAGTPAVFLDERLTVSYMCKLGTDSLLIVFNSAFTSDLRGVIDTITTRTSSIGTTYVVEASYNASTIGAELLSTGRVVLAYNSEGTLTTRRGLVKLLTISGGVISAGGASEFQAAGAQGSGPAGIDIIILTSRAFIISYIDTIPTTDDGMTIYTTILGSTLTLGSQEEWANDGVNDEGESSQDMFLIGTSKLATVFCIGANTYYVMVGLPVAYPTDPVTTLVRVTGLVHRWVPGSYTLEVLLGDVKTIWERPPLRREPLPTMYPRPELPAQTPLPYKYYKPEPSVQDPLRPTPWLPGWNAPLGMPEDEWRALNQPAPETIYLLGDLSDAWRTDR